MSNVSKLVIKACKDNKFSSFTGEFVTSINPENLVIKSAVAYHIPEGTTGSSLLKYRGSPPKLLSFSLLFDNTGIIPGSNAIAVMEQVKKLQEVAYNVHKKNNAPNYIRVIWGQIDFKGRLVDLDIVYSMFHVDGTLVRAEAHIAVLEEITPLGQGKSAAGVDSHYAKGYGANATSNRTLSPSRGMPNQEVFAPTPNGMNGAYSGAPPGAYDGGPDQIYQGSNGSGGGVYDSSGGASPSSSGAYGSSGGSNPSGSGAYGSSGGSNPSSSGAYGSSDGPNSSSGGGYGSDGANPSGGGLQGGVAGNGPGGSGAGIGGGGYGPGSGVSGSRSSSGSRGPGSGAGGSSGSRGPGSGAGGSGKSSVSHGPGSSIGGSGGGSGPALGGAAAGFGIGSVAGAAGKLGGDSLRQLKIDAKNIALKTASNKLGFWARLKMFAKKVAPKTYSAVKQATKRIVK